MQLRKCILCRRVGKQTNLRHTYTHIYAYVCRHSCTTAFIYDSALLNQRLHGTTNKQTNNSCSYLTKGIYYVEDIHLCLHSTHLFWNSPLFIQTLRFGYIHSISMFLIIFLWVLYGNTKLFRIHRIAYAFIAFHCVGATVNALTRSVWWGHNCVIYIRCFNDANAFAHITKMPRDHSLKEDADKV